MINGQTMPSAIAFKSLQERPSRLLFVLGQALIAEMMSASEQLKVSEGS